MDYMDYMGYMRFMGNMGYMSYMCKVGRLMHTGYGVCIMLYGLYNVFVSNGTLGAYGL